MSCTLPSLFHEYLILFAFISPYQCGILSFEAFQNRSSFPSFGSHRLVIHWLAFDKEEMAIARPTRIYSKNCHNINYIVFLWPNQSRVQPGLKEVENILLLVGGEALLTLL